MNIPFERIDAYEEQLYAALLGKLIGVYQGRPFEGWSHGAIEDRLLAKADGPRPAAQSVDRYVHGDLGKPLVVSDDDISGTLTFVRALADSGRGLATDAAFFGDTWRNYLMEGRTILWWGGRGLSTEHTAFLNLSEGVPAPASGSIARNGQTLAEQIGAQIFIDSVGWVLPGRPILAAEVARRAASVSHDGEAVHAAAAVAAMAAAAFVDKRLDRLLDIGAGVLPADSLIARIHQDVRAWTAADGDWRRTFRRIEARYGYDRYGGNCHVVPNHAVMVLAWASAAAARRPSFRQALGVASTCGWDTDCNAGNVAALMGLVVGLDGIDADYDFRGPVADRIVLPTAEGCRAATDAVIEARQLAGIGRRLAGGAGADAEGAARRPLAPPAGTGVRHDFALPGARHGWVPDPTAVGDGDVDGIARLGWVADDGGSLVVELDDLVGDRVARLRTPVLPDAAGARYGGARQVQAIPWLCPGHTVTVRGHAEMGGTLQARLYLRHHTPDADGLATMGGPPRRLRTGGAFRLRLEIPDLGGWPVQDLGIELRAPRGHASGRVRLHEVRISGAARLALTDRLPLADDGGLSGWVCDADRVRNRPFSDDAEPVFRLGRDRGRGVAVTGGPGWTRTRVCARVSLHAGAAAGILAHYGGLQRYVALVYRRREPGSVQLLERVYGDRVLAELPASWAPDELHELVLTCRGATLHATCDGEPLVPLPATGAGGRPDPAAVRSQLAGGGAGFLVDAGLAGFRDVTIEQER